MDLCSPARHIEDAPVHNRFLAVSKSIKDILGDNATKDGSDRRKSASALPTCD
jgi:hypothetical protein